MRSYIASPRLYLMKVLREVGFSLEKGHCRLRKQVWEERYEELVCSKEENGQNQRIT